VADDNAPAPLPTEVVTTQVAALDAWVHQAAQDYAAAHVAHAEVAVEATVDAPIPTPVMESGKSDDGLPTVTYRDDYGDTRTIKYDTEVVSRPAAMIPVELDFDVSTHVHAEGSDAQGMTIHEASASPDAEHSASTSHKASEHAASSHAATHSAGDDVVSDYDGS